jgi:secreted PhoX family phosphatase
MNRSAQRDGSASEYFEALEELPVNPSNAPTLGDVINARFSRRTLLRGALGVTAIGALAASPLALLAAAGRDEPTAGAQHESAEDSAATPGRFGFTEIAHGVDETHHVAPGYRAEVLIRWGDAVLPDSPKFDPRRQSAAAQLKQFGYNNDFIGYIPLPFGSDNADHGLLCVNHEYTDEEVMFPGLGQYDDAFSGATKAIAEIEMACNGGSIIEIKKHDGEWSIIPDSRYARRISALETEMRLSGPAAGHDRLKTSADPTGARVIGTVNNCAGGITPWGTYLMAEENFNFYFLGEIEGHAEQANYARYGIPGKRYPWGKFHPRFDIDAEPNEANRFGWIVEVDPLDPASTPVKRTALGRFKHEGAESIVNKDGRLVLYSGDDQRFEYLYKFITRDSVDPTDRAANRDLLDHGILSVARFDGDGTLTWLPLLHGRGPLTADSGFASQADVLIETRRAATLLGATPMDRPEDVEPNPVTGKVYVMLTNNSKRGTDGQPDPDAANPRAANLWGHVLELTPPDGDHAAESARWDVLIKAGNPADGAVAALWNPATSANGWFACPDNCAIDPSGRLWVSTDQGRAWSQASGGADGVWALETEGSGRGTGRLFFRVPVGAEMCGPRFTPDGKTLFVAVQHPATDGTKDYAGFERSSTFEDPATRWPDFDPKMPPRPSVVVITKDDSGEIGS